MSEEQHIWSKQEGEPSIWYSRFTRFRLMEPTRSIAAVYQQESKSDEEVRSNAPGRWYDEARKWHWEERAEAWDTYQTDQQEKVITQERIKVLKERYALMHKRVQELDRLAQQLIDYTSKEKNVWLPDVKAIGNGPDAERVDLVNFNAPLFREIRGYFDDIAAELGERVKSNKTEHSGSVDFVTQWGNAAANKVSTEGERE